MRGELSLGTLMFLSGAIAGTSSGIQNLFQTFSSVADQALFLNDLLEFLAVQPGQGGFETRSPLPAPRRRFARASNFGTFPSLIPVTTGRC